MSGVEGAVGERTEETGLLVGGEITAAAPAPRSRRHVDTIAQGTQLDNVPLPLPVTCALE